MVAGVRNTDYQRYFPTVLFEYDATIIKKIERNHKSNRTPQK